MIDNFYKNFLNALGYNNNRVVAVYYNMKIEVTESTELILKFL